MLQSELYGLTPLDPPTYAVAVGVLIVMVIGAAYVPAWLAGRRDPAITLRLES